jgi:methionyl-tRNA formyltransferase
VANGEIVFYGTAAIGLPILRELHARYRLSLIITQPDTRGGRNRQRIESPVKRFALENNIALIQPPSLREAGLAATISHGHPLIAVVVAYGQFIPRELYSLPRFKTINVHFSLLPAYRGAAPVQRAIENGETRSGISIFEISGKMDAGDIWIQKKVVINPDDTCGSYQQRLGELAAPLLLETLEQIFSGRLGTAGSDSGQQAAGLHPLAGVVLPDGEPADQDHPCRQQRPIAPGPGREYPGPGRPRPERRLRTRHGPANNRHAA